MGMGGSIPIVAPLVKATGAPCVLMGFGLPGDNLHAPNEHFALDCFFGGAKAAAAYLYEVATRAGISSSR
jgi:acetylornithine deacetylase/succinyl-diaminopimelate desuccinylase-like protein